MANKGYQRGLGATAGGLRPGDYALGSLESRAAVRALLDAQFAERPKINVTVICIGQGPEWTDRCSLGEWKECVDGSLMRMNYLPSGMTIEEAESIVAARAMNHRL